MPKIGDSKAVSTPSPSSQEKVSGKGSKSAHSAVWQMRSISVEMEENGVLSKEKTAARCCGGIAVHKALGERETGWVITAINIGLIACKVPTEVDAIRIAAVLVGQCHKPFTLLTKEEIRAALPPWVEPWLVACRRERKYLDDPTSFKKENK